jgi:energy-coupling factor transport system permease protein
MDLFSGGAGWLQRADARVKLLAAVLATGVLALTAGLWLLVAWIVACNLALLSSGVSARKLRWAWLTTAPVLASIVVLWPLFAREGAVILLAVGPVDVSLEELGRGFATALRIAGLAFAWLGVLFTTDQAHLVRGLVRLGLSHRAGMVFVLALRSIWLLQEVHAGVMDAQQARGLVLRGANPIAQARARLPILVAVLVNAIRMTDSLTLALSARGYESASPRTVYRDLRMSRTDWALLSAVVVLAGVAFWSRLALGVGASPLAWP